MQMKHCQPNHVPNTNTTIMIHITGVDTKISVPKSFLVFTESLGGSYLKTVSHRAYTKVDR